MMVAMGSMGGESITSLPAYEGPDEAPSAAPVVVHDTIANLAITLLVLAQKLRLIVWA